MGYSGGARVFAPFRGAGFLHYFRLSSPCCPLDRTKDGLAVALFKRYWALAYVVVPMLVIVPVLDHIGFLTNQELYRMHFRFPEKTMGGPESFAEFSVIFLSSMLYLNEILIFKLTGLFPRHPVVSSPSATMHFGSCVICFRSPRCLP